MTIAPEGRRLLRVEARNAETPIERKPPWIKVKAKMGPEFTALPRSGSARRPAHRLPGGRLSQHLRVLGRPRGHLPDRRRPVHPALRLLPDRHRQAGRVRRRRAAPRRRVGRHDGPALRDGHRRRPRRPAGRRRLALRRDGPPDPRPPGGLRRRAAHPGLQRHARAAARGLRVPPRGARPQRRDGPADLQADPAGLPLRPLARRDHPGPRRRPGDQVQPDPGHGRGAVARSPRRCATCTTPVAS